MSFSRILLSLCILLLDASPLTASPELNQLKTCTAKLSAMKSDYDLNSIRNVLGNLEPRLGNMIQGSEIVQANAVQLEVLAKKNSSDPGLSHLIANAAVGCDAYYSNLLSYVRKTLAFGAALLLTVSALVAYYFYLSRDLLAVRPID